MRGLQEIIEINERAQREQEGRQGAEGFHVALDKELRIDPQPGVIHVWNRNGMHIVVDCSDPHYEQPLVDFHRNWNGPKSIRMRVEALASQHRRTLIRAA